MMSQPYLPCPLHAGRARRCLLVPGESAKRRQAGVEPGWADQSDSRGGLRAAAGPISAAPAGGEEQGSDGVPCWPSDRVPAIICLYRPAMAATVTAMVTAHAHDDVGSDPGVGVHAFSQF